MILYCLDMLFRIVYFFFGHCHVTLEARIVNLGSESQQRHEYSWKCVTPSQAKHLVQPDHVMGRECVCMCTPCLPTNDRPGVVIGYSVDDRLMNCSVIDLSTTLY